MKKLSYANGASKTPLLGKTISEALRNTVERYGDTEALVVVEQNYRATYKELWAQIEKVAKALLAVGIKKGDRVGIWSANRHEWVLVQFATARIGAIMVNINPGYKSEGIEYA
ncbi:MAG: AMP-binding protein, partial [Bacteroidales bacterium]